MVRVASKKALGGSRGTPGLNDHPRFSSAFLWKPSMFPMVDFVEKPWMAFQQPMSSEA